MENRITIGEAGQQLSELTQQIKAESEKFILLNNKNEPEAVLLSISEYQGLVAASELLANVEVLKDTHAGIEELKSNQGLSIQEAFRAKAKTHHG
jgi:PHD/YefM family antitoxin component YafN of YafNO toxin-antitoxin module